MRRNVSLLHRGILALGVGLSVFVLASRLDAAQDERAKALRRELRAQGLRGQELRQGLRQARAATRAQRLAIEGLQSRAARRALRREQPLLRSRNLAPAEARRLQRDLTAQQRALRQRFQQDLMEQRARLRALRLQRFNRLHAPRPSRLDRRLAQWIRHHDPEAARTIVLLP